mmetsp:Transcript_8221/g.8222  ORF Transcript_8221/g.8222 Transcript_8221/m.8222 type:complete len:291 (+) Transcript_8221:91-963(+)
MYGKYVVRMLFCVSLLMMIATQSFAARGMWGSNKKRKEDEEEDADDIAGGIGMGFETRNQMANKPKTGGEINSFGGATTGGAGGMGDTIETMINMYITMMEELVESPDFEALVTPEAIKSMFSQVPGLSSQPELVAMLDSPQLNDPRLLKQTIQQGMGAIRGYTSEIVDVFSSPAKMEQLLDQLPAEFKGPIQQLLKGDVSGVKDVLSSIPGLAPAQQSMLMNLLEGNMEGIASNAKQLLSDPDQTEAARQQFLENPQMAEMFGISEDVINDKVAFEGLMAQGTYSSNKA